MNGVYTYSNTIIPSVNSDSEGDVSRKDVVLDCGWTVERRRVVVTPDRGANANAKIKELLADDLVVRYLHIRIATLVLPVHHVNGTEPALCRRGLDGVSGDFTSGGTEDYNPTVG